MSKPADRPDLDLDKSSEQGFCKFYASLDAQENTIRVFERSNGDYYSVHGADAEYVANVVYKTTTVIKYIGGGSSTGLASCTMSRIVAENFLRDALLKYQLRVEIYAPQDSGKPGPWKVLRTASPGNLQQVEELLFANTEMVTVPLVMAVAFKVAVDQMQCGVAFVDPAQRSMGVCEFTDNDVFSNLESLVIQLGVRECLVETPTAVRHLEHTKLVSVLERCGVVVTERPRSQFSSTDMEQDLGRLLELTAPVASLPELDLKSAMSTLAAIILYLNLLMDETNFGSYLLSTHSLSQYMKLDASAVQALNLVPSPQDGSSKTMSLQGLLNHCKTSQGERLLAQWLKQPLLSIEAIEDRLGLVELFFADTETRNTLRSVHLRSMPDFKRLSSRFQRGFASLQDIVRVYQVAIALPALCDVLSGVSQPLVVKYYLQDLLAITEDLQEFRSLVETTVDLEMVDNHEFMLRADFDEGLQETKAKMEEEMGQILAEQAQVAEALDLEANKKLKLERHSTYGHCLRVSRIDAARLRGKSTKYVELSTQKTGVYFTTPTLRDSSRAYRDLSDSYTKAQTALVREVIKVASSYCSVLERLNKTVAHLDVILSFAEASASAPTPYVRPTLKPDGDLRLVAARHPCLEVQDGVSFIANDVSMVKGESEFVIITGPNMGGKSTYIRQIGVIALMAQVGCFVPCDSAELYIFDCILARVGAGDAQLKGVSTFMAEMLETASILKTATPKSLVIIDELGRGTSTYDGFGLAWAISEHIVKEIGCKCLFATHFHELTELEAIYPSVDNRHVMARIANNTASSGQRDLTLLYKIGQGVCDQSFGIHVAELANFPESVVRLAKRKVEELEDFGAKDAGGDAMDVDSPGSDVFTKKQMAEGSKLIELFLSEFSSTPGLSDMASDQIALRVNELRAKYDSDISANAWVQHVIATL
ncbi:MSH2 protein [Coemansia sp. RSA 2671]|uniref:MSH2 protein n=1 Tax=Coemansia linderi TaxID=2663919 RepID=A0ACC1KNC9_9FUNG|nr:MSH2 protein [Coemansia sp. RSA 2675]KAJ2348947.1 MSH2 protein [Coemansia sp. RSA 2671]KAJ2792032.1 MSH2 protein [Coemansia linderi]